MAESEGKCLSLTRGGVMLLQSMLQYREPREGRSALDNFGDIRRAEKLVERLEEEYSDTPPETDPSETGPNDEQKKWHMAECKLDLKAKEIETVKKAFNFILGKKDVFGTIHLATFMEQLDLVKAVKVAEPAQHTLKITRAGMTLLHASLMSKPWTDKTFSRYVGSLVVYMIEELYAGQTLPKDAKPERRKAFAEEILTLNLTEKARDVCKEVFEHFTSERVFPVDKHTVLLGEQLGFTGDEE